MPKQSDGGFCQLHATLVIGSVVIAQDYFKLVIAEILSLLGKNLTVYEILLERARREALVRMKHQADALGYHHIVGVRFEIATLDLSVVEVVAYGTAVHVSVPDKVASVPTVL